MELEVLGGQGACGSQGRVCRGKHSTERTREDLERAPRVSLSTLLISSHSPWPKWKPFKLQDNSTVLRTCVTGRKKLVLD